jgi:hypothetical protein
MSFMRLHGLIWLSDRLLHDFTMLLHDFVIFFLDVKNLTIKEL